MKNYLPLLLATFLILSTTAFAQDALRPGVQAPGFWLISPTSPAAGAVGLECVESMQATYTIVFPAEAPTTGQSLVVTSIDENTHRVYTTWQLVGAAPPSIVHSLVHVDVDLPVIPQNSTHVATLYVPDASVGSVVTINPSTELPDGIVIGSARVVEGGKVHVRVVNVSAAAIDCDATQWGVAYFLRPDTHDLQR